MRAFASATPADGVASSDMGCGGFYPGVPKSSLALLDHPVGTPGYSEVCLVAEAVATTSDAASLTGDTEGVILAAEVVATIGFMGSEWLGSCFLLF